MSQPMPPSLPPPPVGRNALIATVVTALIGIAATFGYYVAPACPQFPPCAPVPSTTVQPSQ